MRKVSVILFVALAALCIAQGLYYYPQLPDTVASHFSLSGNPDATSSKAFLITVYYAVVGVLVALFLWVGLRLPRLPATHLNMPHKEHWMSDARQADTRSFISSSMFWLGSAAMLLVLDVFHQTFRVGLGRASQLSHVALSFALFAIFVVVWIVRSYRRFATLKKGAGSS